MIAYLVFSISNAKLISLKKKFNHKNYIYITDKIAIYNYLKLNKLNTILLESLISTKLKNKLFFKNYDEISSKIKKIGSKLQIKIEKKYYNTIYINFRGIAPRLYTGIQLNLFALKKIITNKKINTLVYLNDCENLFLDDKFYFNLYRYFSKKNKIKFISLKLTKENKYLINILKNILNIIYIFREINIFNCKYFIKKLLSKITFFKKKYLILGESMDLKYSNYNLFKTKFLKLKPLNKKIKNKKFTLELVKKNYQRPEDILFDYIINKNFFLNNISINLIQFFKKKFDYNKQLKIFWGLSPDIKYRTLLSYLITKYKVFGFQHGGKQLVMKNRESLNKDYEYPFCTSYYSYGFSKFFNKKNLKIKNNLINLGCYKSDYHELILKNSIVNNKNLLYVPNSLSSFSLPTLEILASEKYKIQLTILKYLNSQKLFNVYVKDFLYRKFYNYIINEELFHLNPIFENLNQFKSIKSCRISIEGSINLKKPKVIIFDSFSTPVYEVLTSKCEIIILIDKYEILKPDVKKLLTKRVHLVYDINQLKNTLNKIYFNQNIKKFNNEFYKKFYKLKKIYSHEVYK